MLATCFSTAPSLTTIALAMAALERPSAMRPRTSRSRGVSTESESRPAGGAEELRHHFGIQGRTSNGDPLERLDEVADVGHPVLEQVPDTGGVVRQQVGGVPGLDVLREQQDAESLVALAQVEREAQALVGEGGRHADVDHGDVGRVLGDRAAQRLGVPDGPRDGETAIDQ